jgi:hypothetical protein
MPEDVEVDGCMDECWMHGAEDGSALQQECIQVDAVFVGLHM